MRKSSRATGDFIFFHFFMQSLQQSSLPNELGSLSLSLLWLDLESRYFFGGIVLGLDHHSLWSQFSSKRISGVHLDMLNWDALGLSFDKRVDE